MTLVSEGVFAEIAARLEASKADRAERMPTEVECLRVMFDAYTRLQELGWKDAIYCPKDGTVFDSISADSTGIHPCHYDGPWPTGHWWVHEAHDLWPARPILFRDARSQDGAAGRQGEVPAGQQEPSGER